LAALRKISPPVKIIYLKETGGFLTNRGGEDGGIYQYKIPTVKKLADGPDNLTSDFEVGMLLFGT